MVFALKAKLVSYLQKVGETGATRTQLLQKFKNCRVADLEAALRPLLAENTVVEWTDVQKLGRPSTHYYHVKHASGLTALRTAAIPVIQEEHPTRSSLCKVCGVAIPCPEKGRPYDYCSPACRRAAHEGGCTMADFLLPAADPRVFAEVAVFLVMADLTMRGFRVAREFYRTGSHLLVVNEGGGTHLVVIPVGLSGTFPDPLEFEAMAAVYRDGRIAYGGRNPIVEPEVEEKE